MNAAEARQKAELYKNCPEVLQKIDESVKDGALSCIINGHIEKDVEILLVVLGYEVSYYQLPTETVIRW